jgi:hypothetical protein
MRNLSRIWNSWRGRGPVALGLALALLAVPSTASAQVFFDDMESGPGLWVVDTAIPLGAPWAIVTTQSHSPVSSWFTDDPANISDKRVRMANAVVVPGAASLSFWLRWDMELNFDGAVLEYSLDNGTTWSDILAAQGSVPADPARITQTPYTGTISVNFQSPIAGRQAWSGANLAFTEVRVNLGAFAGLSTMFRWRFASDNSVSDVGIWLDDVTIASALQATAINVDPGGNNVLEANEDAVMAPTWRNNSASAVSVTGTLSNFTGPAGPTYTIVDGTANYGSIPANGTASCGADCYTIRTDAASRPAVHWDSTVRETLTGNITHDWTLHVAGSFDDVTAANPFYRFIETLLHNEVTGGCSATSYCPGSPTTREQMAVFVLVAREGAAYSPAACGAVTIFADVPSSSPFCRWIEELARRGVVSGCGGANYCPTSSVTREQMAVFVLLTLDPAMNPPACVAGSEMFADVPSTSGFCRWIEELANRGVVTGCGGGNYCPTSPVTREQMGVFLSVTFSLSLYGV